ncbi:hypothetical protein BD324DRAFT_608786 [Kockovaella imperatae]|uniref:Uncharacterized protein n=1 Tax=Kockovaella imperatae TaxID=4999 RepID=A0A1Y1UFF2_9TREE|nr:hypothetical protein BD324DRAFT_608786 [Kockovaella imperatae]ORX36719.1 hypothetical protein BD324DRAFT_608786 [Kockovaella imperatae]
MVSTGLGQRPALIVEEGQADGPRIVDESDHDHDLSAMISPSATCPPLAVSAPINKQRARSRLYQLQEAQRFAWQHDICHHPKHGFCIRPQSEGSVYCTVHSCFAINDDGNRCGNLVIDPTVSRYCSSGWHNENRRYSHVEDLKAARRARESMLAKERESELAERVSYFSTHFSSALESSSSQSSTCSSSRTGPSSSSSPISKSESLVPESDKDGSARGTHRQRSTSLEHERGWGAHGIDKWWVGDWSRKFAPSAPAGQ